jgi:hypothetical protein
LAYTILVIRNLCRRPGSAARYSLLREPKIQQVKQCAGCGAQMGARGRVCPRCGRGSLFGELAWMAVLGVLLLGIALLLGVIPMDRIRGLAGGEPVTRPAPTTSKAATPTRASLRHHKPRQRQEVETVLPADSTFTRIPCSGTDTYALRQEAKESPHKGPHAPAGTGCREGSSSAVGSGPKAILDTIAPSQ